MDARLKLSSGCIIVGPSQSGKTLWCKRLLKCAKDVFDTPINKIYWYYGIWNVGLLDFKNDKNIFVREGMPQSPSEIEPNSIVVIDDQIDGDFTHIFTTWTHHFSIFCCKIVQNLYHKPKDRTSNLCAQYIVLLKYPGDKLTIKTLAYQMQKSWVMQVYEDVTHKPYSYLFIDLHQQTPEAIRVRTNILPGEGMLTVFTERRVKKYRKKL
jgi:hypothetical protein